MGIVLDSQSRPNAVATRIGELAMMKSRGAGYLAAASAVLRRSSVPLNCREIVERGVAVGLLSPCGKTPEKSLHGMLSRHIAGHGSASEFRKVARGKFAIVRSR